MTRLLSYSYIAIQRFNDAKYKTKVNLLHNLKFLKKIDEIGLLQTKLIINLAVISIHRYKWPYQSRYLQELAHLFKLSNLYWSPFDGCSVFFIGRKMSSTRYYSYTRNKINVIYWHDIKSFVCACNTYLPKWNNHSWN